VREKIDYSELRLWLLLLRKRCKTARQARSSQVAPLKMEPRHRKLNEDDYEDAEYIDEHNDDDEMMCSIEWNAVNSGHLVP
jgi:hypothetical protein